MEESFKIISEKEKELLETLGWVEEKDNKAEWKFRPF